MHNVWDTIKGVGVFLGGLLGTFMTDSMPYLSFIAVATGAILGVHGVWGIIKGRKNNHLPHNGIDHGSG